PAEGRGRDERAQARPRQGGGEPPRLSRGQGRGRDLEGQVLDPRGEVERTLARTRGDRLEAAGGPGGGPQGAGAPEAAPIAPSRRHGGRGSGPRGPDGRYLGGRGRGSEPGGARGR